VVVALVVLVVVPESFRKVSCFSRPPTFVPNNVTMFQWAQSTFDKLAQTVAPPPDDAVGKFVYCVQRGEEEAAMGCIAGIPNPNFTVVHATRGQYPLHLACQYSCQRLLLLLLNQPGVDIQQPDMVGNTPLHYASMSTSTESLNVVKLLITQFHASVLAKNAKGETPYDVAALNVVRQHLLPIQLQAETQIALDNGGQGLPPGIDLGGLRIHNPAMPPPPTFAGGAVGGGGMGSSGLVGAPTPFSSPSPGQPYATVGGGGPPPAFGNNGMVSTPAPELPASHMFGTPSPSMTTTTRIASAPAPVSGPDAHTHGVSSGTDGRGHRAVSSSSSLSQAVTPAPTSNGRMEYSRVGSSSAALGVGKYRPDGFHSSSSDVSLQKKYGHSHTSSYGSTTFAPPPSSGNGSIGGMSAGATSPDSGGVVGGPNPFSALATTNRYGALNNNRGRYVAYGQVAAAPVSSSPATPNMQPYGMGGYGMGGAGSSSGPISTFTPGGGSISAPTSFGAVASAPASSFGTAPGSFGAPNMNSVGTSSVGTPVPMRSPAKASNVANTVMSSPPYHSRDSSLLYASSAQIADVNAEEMFSQPSPLKETVTPSPPVDESTVPSTDEVVENSDTPVASSSDLPSDWVEALDPTSGQVYYYNSVTHETSWEYPGAPLPDDWVETTDPSSGQVYYYNSVTQETSWERPSASTAAGSADSTLPNAEYGAPISTEANSESPALYEPTPAPTVVEPAPFSGSHTFVPPTVFDSSSGPSTNVATFVTSSPLPSRTDAFLASRSMSADELFAEDAPAEDTPEQTSDLQTPTTVEVQSSVEIPLRQSMSADEVFTEYAAPKPLETETMVPTTTTPYIATEPRSLSADELFAEYTPDIGESVPTVRKEVSPYAAPRKRTASADEVLGENAPFEDVADVVTSPPTPSTPAADANNDDDDEGLEDMPLSDIPLSPNGIAPSTEGIPETTVPTSPPRPIVDNSLFAAIGMPPPPFSAKKR